MQRTIIHADMNNFYASVECLYHPEIRDKPVVVGGDPEARHGIVLAKNYVAKKYGITTGEVLWQARQKCPGLVVVPPDFEKYLKFSRMVRGIFGSYTDQVEPFGLDEAWLDVTGSVIVRGNGELIANEIRQRVKDELGITASVGVADNKIFAKLGSDMKKPDATTIITRQNFKDKVWPLPAEDLLYVGHSTKHKLYLVNILTIGDIAKSEPSMLHAYLGKWGEVLWSFANGYDQSPVAAPTDETGIIKSIGNSTTTPRDLIDNEDVKMTMCVLAESVASRLRDHGFKCKTVQISVRDNDLSSFERQAKLQHPSQVSGDILDLAMKLFEANYAWSKPIRSVGVRGADLVSAIGNKQLSFLDDDVKEERLIRLESTIDRLRERFGHFSVQRALLLKDKPLTDLDPKNDHVIYPVAYK
jgi:DNA polymerase-4